MVGSQNFVYRGQPKQYTYEVDENPRIRTVDDCLSVGNHASHGVRSSWGDNDTCGTGVLSPHGGAMWKLHDAGQSFLL
jgi:hypothetical protein